MKRRFPTLSLITILILLLFCLAIVILGGLAIGLPQRAAQIYGPPQPSLSTAQSMIYAIQLLLKEKTLLSPSDPVGAPVAFQIALGESTSSVINRLEQHGLISDGEAFRTFLLYSGLDTSLQAGDYTLNPAMTPIEIAQALQDATPQEINFHVLPGWRMEEIAAALPTSGLNFSPEEFIQAAHAHPQGYVFSASIPANATLEGFFYPDTYRFSRDISVDGFITAMLDNFQNKLTPDIQQGINRQGLDIFQAITLASIVQKESINEDEMPLIASVFLNRLANGIKLESDPTVQYALGYNTTTGTWWTNPLSLQDLQTNSPFNTYLYPGLPPGPIANPGFTAIKAVAFPAQTPYFYFRATCDGSGKHVFSQTYEEHVQNACP